MTVTNGCGQTLVQYNTQTGDAGNTLFNVSPGTAGQVLTSNGASAQPTYQSTGIAPTSNAVVTLKDDFIGTITTNAVDLRQISGELGWFTNTTTSVWTPGSAQTSAAHPGVWDSGVLSNPSNTFSCLFLGSNNLSTGVNPNEWILGGGVITMNWVFNITSLSNGTNRYIFRFGFGSTASAADQVNGTYFEYSDNINTGQWNYKTASASTRTTSSSTIAVTTGWHNAQLVVNAAASSISFSIDGVSLGAAIATNIPTVGVSPFMQLAWVAGTTGAGAVAIDLFYANQILTTPR
jgi:hypothetical protein